MIGFGVFGKKWELEISSTDDPRLVKVDPTSNGFFDNVLEFVTEDIKIQRFIEAVREVKEANLSPFWKPVFDPSFDGDKVLFRPGGEPAVGYSYNFWEQKAQEMQAESGRKWSIGSEYQYYAFLTKLIDLYARGDRRNIEIAMKYFVLSPEDRGEQRYAEDRSKSLEKTGSGRLLGEFYDIRNTFKLLSCTNKEAGGFWWAGCSDVFGSEVLSLASLEHEDERDINYNDAVGWLVIS